MTRRIVFLALAVLLLSSSLSWSKDDNRPLFTDSLTDWQIWKAIPGSSIVEKYEYYYQQFGSLTPKPPAHVAFIYEDGASRWYLFSLVIPAGVITYWKPTTELVLFYEHGDDTVSVTSNMFFFMNAARTRLFFSYEINGLFSVPNVAMPLYSSTQVPAVFVRFDFKNKQPDRLLYVVPKEVRVQ